MHRVLRDVYIDLLAHILKASLRCYFEHINWKDIPKRGNYIAWQHEASDQAIRLIQGVQCGDSGTLCVPSARCGPSCIAGSGKYKGEILQRCKAEPLASSCFTSWVARCVENHCYRENRSPSHEVQVDSDGTCIRFRKRKFDQVRRFAKQNTANLLRC